MSAESGYGQVRRQTGSPRTIEYQLLLQLANGMESADPTTVDGFKALATAVKKNSDLWFTFSLEVANPENPLDAVLKEAIVKLAAFSMAHGQKVLSGADNVAPLVRVNRMIAAGLRDQTAAAA